MAITTRDGLISAMAGAQGVQWNKTATRTTVATIWFSLFDLAGSPGGGTLAGASTAAGVVPTDATTGCPTIGAFGGGATGYLSQLRFSSTVACRIKVFDLLFKAGAYAFNASTSLASQPSFSSRATGLPGGDYYGTSIWLEAVTAFTGNQSCAVTYTNEAGTTARTTGTVATGTAPIVGRMFRMPLQAGDNGVSVIESVTSTVSSAGTFNVLVLRELAEVRVRSANDGGSLGPDLTGLPMLFADSALFVAVAADSTSSGIPDLTITVANG